MYARVIRGGDIFRQGGLFFRRNDPTKSLFTVRTRYLLCVLFVKTSEFSVKTSTEL